ncbi:(Fe-S)-binding protein [Cyclobacterium qasimii]|uniref:Fe-S protein n=1 Tax=Cyclobacterium qasimii M12-11B TaxID=641524 RepID=S7VNG4_9BACT|nr:Fe-S protein [Cyclobacterium qasimii]EPR70922.1 Fe-S protein [Cyclobacterium qasimii M12-11B]
MNYHEPEIGKDAVKLLNDCGYEVILANVGCCQRPKISHGFLREAKDAGYVTIKELVKFIDKGLKVVVCEPSCASALNDDFPDLLPDEGLASKLKTNVLMIDVFLHQEMKNGVINVKLQAKEGKLHVHGHCHQKALYGTQAMKQTLANPEEFDEIPSGCCGMAGSFGYEKEHYDLSEKIGDEILFPSVKKLPENTSVTACGFSCRHQIGHFTGVKTKHWVSCVEVIKPKV